MNKLTNHQRKIALLVLLIAISATTYGILQVNYALVFIIAIPAVFGYLFWYYTYLRRPTEPKTILPIFMLTIAGFDFHVIEEYLGGYSLAISRIFNFAWTDSAFFLTICILSGALMLTCVGLYYKKEIAGFIAIMFIITRFAEIALFIFPFVPPALQPNNPEKISATVNGTFVLGMPNYFYSAKQVFYFPGMFTVALAIIPAGVAIYKIWKSYQSERI
jgi:hypothetical protein